MMGQLHRSALKAQLKFRIHCSPQSFDDSCNWKKESLRIQRFNRILCERSPSHRCSEEIQTEETGSKKPVKMTRSKVIEFDGKLCSFNFTVYSMWYFQCVLTESSSNNQLVPGRMGHWILRFDVVNLQDRMQPLLDDWKKSDCV